MHGVFAHDSWRRGWDTSDASDALDCRRDIRC